MTQPAQRPAIATNIQPLAVFQGVVLLCMVVLALAGGCASLKPKKVQLDNRAGIYDSAQLTYEIDSSRLGEPLPIARIEGQQVSYDQQATAPQPGSAHGKLTIVYPHPENRPGTALARLEINSRVGSQAGPPRSTTEVLTRNVENGLKAVAPWPRNDTIEEVWTLDVPKDEVDRAINQLDATGYFQGRGAGKPGINVSAVIDGAAKQRRWEQVGELDALMVRVRTSGRLETYRRPQHMTAGPRPQFSSVAAYRRSMGGEAANTQIAQAAPPVVPFQAPAGGVTAPSQNTIAAQGAVAQTAPQGYVASPYSSVPNAAWQPMQPNVPAVQPLVAAPTAPLSSNNTANRAPVTYGPYRAYR